MKLSAEMLARVEEMIETGQARQIMLPVHIDQPLTTSAPMPRGMAEKEFTSQFITAAQNRGWKAAHFRPARVVNPDGSVGWRTAVEGDGKGFPDVILIRERVVWVELKSEKGRQSKAQKEWQEHLEAIGEEFHLWRPRHWPEIIETLQRRTDGG